MAGKFDASNIGIKNINTNVLSTSVQKNFELIKDGTGKALLELDGMLGGIFGSLKELINTALNFISGIIDSILNIINAVLNFIKRLIEMILGFIRSALNLLIGKLCMMLGIPMGQRTEIVVRIMSYMRQSMGAFGALLSGKAKLMKNYNIKDLGTLFITDLLNVSLVSGVLSTIRDLRDYDNILKKLIDACGLTTVVRGMRQMFANGSQFDLYHYDRFYSVAEEYFRDMGDGGTQYEIFQLLNNKQFIQMEYLKRYNINNYGTLFTIYKRLGFDQNRLGYLIEITSMSSLDDLIPKPYQNLNYDITPEEVESQVGDEYTLFEKVAIVRNGGSTIVREPVVYDESAEGIMKYKRNADSFNKYVKNKYPMARDKDLDVTKPYNLSNPMTFKLGDYNSSIKVDTTTLSTTGKVQSICGINGMTIEENTRQVEFEGFSNKVELDPVDENIIKESKYTDKKTFKI